MSVVYSSRISIELHLRKTFLESHDILCEILGESLLIARPEIPGYATLEVKDPKDFLNAIQLLKAFEKGEGSTETWTCDLCGEKIEGQFSECWKCTAS